MVNKSQGFFRFKKNLKVWEVKGLEDLIQCNGSEIWDSLQRHALIYEMKRFLYSKKGEFGLITGACN